MTKHTCRKPAFLPIMLIMALSCSEPYPPIDRKTAEDLAAEAEARKITKDIGGVLQKGPFTVNSSVNLYELDSSFAQTGNSFQGTIKDDKGSFEAKAVKLVSPYVMLKAFGYYRNEVSGDVSDSQIELFAIADISDKSSVNVNILTHLEYYRVLALINGGKSIGDAKKQAQGEILAVFGMDGGSFGMSEDMSVFGAGESDAALLAISVLLQGDRKEGDFSELLGVFSQGLEEKGAWDDNAKKAEIADWASGADLAGIRSNILGWQLSTDVPDFEKHVYNYWTLNYGLGVCGASSEGISKKNGNALSAKKDVNYICLGNSWEEDVYERCGGKIYNPLDSFCYAGDNKVYELCGVGKREYDRATQICEGGVVKTECGTGWHDTTKYYCFNGSSSSCGDKPLNPDTQFCLNSVRYDKCSGETFTSSQFCSGNTIHDKCGGTVTFTPGTEDCCGNDKYTLATHYCYNGQTYSCNNQPYNPSTHFCLGNTVTPLCGGETFTSSQFCYNNNIENKCGGTVTFTPGTEDCCGNNKYTLSTYFCDVRDSKTYKKVEISTQTWMAENLNYNASGSRCYGDNSGGDSQNRCGTYGRLYNWWTAMNEAASSTANPSGRQGVCPSGWHLPSNAEWTALTDFVGGSSTAGVKLKSTSGWNSNSNGTDEFGFSALPGGSGLSGGSFSSVGNFGNWWSANEDSSDIAYSCFMSYISVVANLSTSGKALLFSVRCVKD